MIKGMGFFMVMPQRKSMAWIKYFNELSFEGVLRIQPFPLFGPEPPSHIKKFEEPLKRRRHTACQEIAQDVELLRREINHRTPRVP